MEAQPERDISEIDTNQVLASLQERLNNGEVPSTLGEKAIGPKDPNLRLVYSTDEGQNRRIASDIDYGVELVEGARAPGLNDEETHMLTLLARGFSVGEIAESRGMSEGFATQLLGIAAGKASDSEWVKQNLFGQKQEKTQNYSPQEQVVNWMHSLRSQKSASDLDLRFTMGKLTNWKLHHQSVDGAGLAWFVRPIGEEVDEEAIAKAKMICKKEDVYVEASEGRVDVEIQTAVLRPIHLARIALVDLACTTKDGNLQPVLGRYDDYGKTSAFGGSIRRRDRRPSIAQYKLLGLGEEYRNGVVLKKEHLELLDILGPMEENVLAHSHLSNEAIAKELAVTESTIRTHLHNINNKYGDDQLSPKDTLFTAIGGDLLRLNPIEEEAIKDKYLGPLSPAEDVAFCLAANGLTYKQTADILRKSITTVRSQLHNAYVKLGGSHIRENVLIAHLNGIDLSMPSFTTEEA